MFMPVVSASAPVQARTDAVVGRPGGKRSIRTVRRVMSPGRDDRSTAGTPLVIWMADALTESMLNQLHPGSPSTAVKVNTYVFHERLLQR